MKNDKLADILTGVEKQSEPSRLPIEEFLMDETRVELQFSLLENYHSFLTQYAISLDTLSSELSQFALFLCIWSLMLAVSSIWFLVKKKR